MLYRLAGTKTMFSVICQLLCSIKINYTCKLFGSYYRTTMKSHESEGLRSVSTCRMLRFWMFRLNLLCLFAVQVCCECCLLGRAAEEEGLSCDFSLSVSYQCGLVSRACCVDKLPENSTQGKCKWHNTYTQLLFGTKNGNRQRLTLSVWI